MVLNHDQNSESIDFPDSRLGYLVCTHCRGYYELQEGESPDDFVSCECGGPLEYQSAIRFRSRINSPDTDKLDTTLGFSSYNETLEPEIEDNQHSENNALPDNRQVMNQLSHQDNVTPETLNSIQQQDKRDLWDIIDQYKIHEEHAYTTGENDIIEMDRFMMIVDQKRALEDSSPSKWKSISHRIGPIGFLSAAIALLIIVLLLNLAG